ncbi:MAG TPA: DUF3054 domain-containing protein [Mycobacterium sp.]|nr:DUF3054 domain-containing protein [Mycobacterium sp.]
MHRTAALAALTDVGAVVVFCLLGRRSHAEALSLAGLAATMWPFVTGTLTGWVLARGWRRPLAVAPTGVIVWAATVTVGMLLRKVSGQGTATAFVVVATVSTAVLLLGWRAATALAARRR